MSADISMFTGHTLLTDHTIEGIDIFWYSSHFTVVLLLPFGLNLQENLAFFTQDIIFNWFFNNFMYSTALQLKLSRDCCLQW